MKTLALIPARTGSKGVPNKNFRDFCGRPLWRWAYDIGAATCDDMWLSTDAHIRDFQDINRLRRPYPLAQDDTPMLAVVKDVLRFFRPDVIVLLQPTQPLRTVYHVRWALEMLQDADSVVSVIETESPERILTVEDGLIQGLPGPSRRQDARKGYKRDGTVYVVRRETIEAGSLYGNCCRPLLIPSSQSCNIDTEDDWNRAEYMMRERDGLREAG